MDFNDTPEEAAFRTQAQAFLAATCSPKAARKSAERPARMEEAQASYLARAKAYQAKKADAGFAALTWAPEHGGRGLAPIFSVIFGQEEARFDAPGAPFTIGLGMCLPTVIAFGAQPHKERYVRPALRGEEIWCQLFSEPAAGSDVAGIKTRAVRDGDNWRVSGQKVWTSGAHYSDFGLLLARTDPGAHKHKGLTMFFLDMRSKGVEARPIHQASGESEFNEVFFDDVVIPDAQRLGDIGQGWSVALVTLMNERLAVGGSPGPDYQDMMAFAAGALAADGKTSLLADSAFRQSLADWYVSAEGYKLGRFRTMTALSRGQAPGPEASIGKILNANRLQEITSAAIDAQDHYGVVMGQSAASDLFLRSYLWAPGLRIAGGTDEILKNIIAERVLGLPADPRADKGIAFKDLPTGA